MLIQFYNLRVHVSLVIAIDKFLIIRTVLTASNFKPFPYKYCCIRSDGSSIPAKVRKLNILTSLNGTSKFQDTALNHIRILFIGFIAGHLLLTNIRVECILHLMVKVARHFLWQKRHLKLACLFSRIYCKFCVLYVHVCLHSVASVINYASILT